MKQPTKEEITKKQIEIVIDMLQARIESDKDNRILQVLLERYTKASQVLQNKMDFNTIIIEGGCRAYLDAFSDYNNTLLYEMDRAEKLVEEIKGVPNSTLSESEQ